ncbi:MAG: hypothetical protein JWM91_2373 [Rhodospirillales bacterium]|nr:hypothetical protein [Rhodospirillales bacterium]
MDPHNRDRQPEEISNRGKVIGLAVAAALIGLGWLLIQSLGGAAQTQDCVMSGRTNCAPIETPGNP